jgi:hypothetical protein
MEANTTGKIEKKCQNTEKPSFSSENDTPVGG